MSESLKGWLVDPVLPAAGPAQGQVDQVLAFAAAVVDPEAVWQIVQVVADQQTGQVEPVQQTVRVVAVQQTVQVEAALQIVLVQVEVVGHTGVAVVLGTVAVVLGTVAAAVLGTAAAVVHSRAACQVAGQE